jgi:hypothetical protein
MSKARDLANAGTALGAVSATELGYVDGVTSAIQTQIDTKLATATAATTYQAINANVSTTELGYLDGVTSAIQTQLNQKPEYAAGKNKIINGAMDIWQRGTSFTVPNLSYLMDRFYNTGDANLTVTRDTDVPTNPYFTYSAKCVGTTTESFAQKIESFNSASLAGQTVTISLYAKKTAGTGALNINLYYPNVKDTYGAVTQIGSALLMSSNPGSSWARYSVTTTLPANVVNGLLVLIDNTNSHTIFITGVQVEAGSTATAFQTATGTIQGELAACQRYYYRSGGLTAYQRFGSGAAYSSTASYIKQYLPVTMRVAPTAIDYSSNLGLDTYGGGIISLTNLTLDQAGSQIVNMVATVASGLTAYRPYDVIANNNTSTYVGFTAEL